MATSRAALALCVPLILLGAACGGGNAASGGDVTATEKDFAIAVGPASVPAGTVKFTIKNEGPSAHEFVVFKTDLAPDQLPLKGAQVDECGTGVEHIDEKEDIQPGASADLSVDLQAGKYVLICNLPGHYQSGMHAALTVS